MTANGTEGIASSIKTSIAALNLKFKPYCGPETDEHTFEEHMTQVIPFSNVFILVVNDFCPQDANGAMNIDKVNGGAGYLAAEISAFRELIKKKVKNVKDFAVYYCGNQRKTYDQKIGYVRRLLSSVDPDETLYIGNNRYLIDLLEIAKWVIGRNQTHINESVYSDEYVPLECKVKEMVYKKRGALLIEMKKGMGKTRFIKHIKDELFITNSVAMYFNRDEGFSSLGKFRGLFIEQLNENHAETVYLDDYGGLSKESFAHYLNDYIRESFNGEPLIVCLDSIDDCKPTRDNNSVLDLFSDLSLFDEGIVFVFTAKIPEDGKKYSYIMEKFIEGFKGERIKVDGANPQYLHFLYLYYTNHILAKLDPDDISNINPKSLFDSVKPKDMLSFSILFRVVALYLTNHDKPSLEIVKSIETALQYYYSFLKENTSGGEDYGRFIQALLILSISNRPLTLEELDSVSRQCLSVEVSSALLKNSSALSILANTIYREDNNNLYEIRHEKLKELIEGDKENHLSRQMLFDVVEMIFDSLSYSSNNLFEFLKNNPSVNFLVNGYFKQLENEEKGISYLQSVAKHITNLAWGDQSVDVYREQPFLLTLVNLPLFEKCDDLTRAIILTRLSIDELLMSYIYDSLGHSDEALKIFRQHKDELHGRDLFFYVNALDVYGNLLCRMDNFEDPVPYIEESLGHCRILLKEGIIPLHDFTNELLSYGNVLNFIRNDLEGDKKTIDEAKALLDASTDVNDLGQYGWWHQRYSFWLHRSGRHQEADQELEKAVEAYIYAFERAPDCFYFGNLVDSMGAYLRNTNPEQTSLDEARKLVKEKELLLDKMAKSINFFFQREFIFFCNNVANLFLKYNAYHDALEYFNRTLDLLNSVGKDTINGSDFISKQKRDITKKIDEISKLLK